MPIEKPATSEYPIHDLLKRRWSPRAFSSRAVEPEKLQSLFEAARWAPSCFNEQPWSFILATKQDTDDFSRLLGCLVEANQIWAEQAPVLVLSVAHLTFSRNGNPNRHAWHDVGLAVENLVVQATALGLVAHQMAGFDGAKARKTFDIPHDYEPVTAIAVGYLGESHVLPDDLREQEEAPRTRKPLVDCVYAGRWQHPSPLFHRSS